MDTGRPKSGNKEQGKSNAEQNKAPKAKAELEKAGKLEHSKLSVICNR